MAVGALAAFSGRWFVVKIGGEIAADRSALARGVGNAIRVFLEADIKVAVVHGAGPQATALSKRLGLTPRLIDGRRVTDSETLEVMKMTLAGQVSVDVAAAFRMANLPALATTGVSAALVEARKRPASSMRGAGREPVDMGWVGDVTGVNVALFEKLASVGLVPVLGSLAADAQGNVFNINADTVATRVAAQLRAAKLFLVSNVPGILLDPDDIHTRVPRLTPAQARAHMSSGAIRAGMIPKVEESLAMLDAGIDQIHIVGSDPPEALLGEAVEAGSFGTVFERP